MTSHKVLKITDFNFSEFGSLIGIVTPQLASELMSLNMENNRNISTTVVKRYAQIMTEGSWYLSDPIKFTKDGELIDGQHRLTALIKSGTSQVFVCLTGYDKKSAEVLDQGKKRLALDVAKIRGVYMTSHHISIMRMLTMLAEGSSSSSGMHLKLTPSEIVSACDIHIDLLNFCLEYSNKKSGIKFSPVLSAVALAYPYENHKRLTEFLYCWNTGTVLIGAEDNAAIKLRELYHRTFADGYGTQARINFAFKAQSALSAFLKNTVNVNHFKGLQASKWSTALFKPEFLKQKIKEFDAQ
jgi:hypothetical protein